MVPKRRRGNSEGSIYKLSDGRWRAAVSLGWKKNEEGQKIWKRRVITGASRHEVAEQLKTMLGAQQRGINIDPGKRYDSIWSDPAHECRGVAESGPPDHSG